MGRSVRMGRWWGAWPPRAWAGALIALLVTITFLALTPHPPRSLDTGWDKLNHTLAFAALAFCACGAARRSRWQLMAWLIALLAYGGGIELAQTLMPGRSGEWADWLGDGVGLLCGAAVGWWCFVPRRQAW